MQVFVSLEIPILLYNTRLSDLYCFFVSGKKKKKKALKTQNQNTG